MYVCLFFKYFVLFVGQAKQNLANVTDVFRQTLPENINCIRVEQTFGSWNAHGHSRCYCHPVVKCCNARHYLNGLIGALQAKKRHDTRRRSFKMFPTCLIIYLYVDRCIIFNILILYINIYQLSWVENAVLISTPSTGAPYWSDNIFPSHPAEPQVPNEDHWQNAYVTSSCDDELTQQLPWWVSTERKDCGDRWRRGGLLK